MSGHEIDFADVDTSPVPPAMRTFKVILERRAEPRYLEGAERPQEQSVVYVDAHSVTCLDDAAHFYVYRPTSTPEGVVLAAYAVRTLRPYLDVEDVSSQVATTPTSMN